MLRLYDRERSGNCYKVRLMLSLLGLEYERVPVHREGKGRNILPPGYERLNPLRQIPVLVTENGSPDTDVRWRGRTARRIGCGLRRSLRRPHARHCCDHEDLIPAGVHVKTALSKFNKEEMIWLCTELACRRWLPYSAAR
jgi:hypothetical protein